MGLTKIVIRSTPHADFFGEHMERKLSVERTCKDQESLKDHITEG